MRLTLYVARDCHLCELARADLARLRQTPVEGARASENRVGVGVAARLSRYLQVLTQAQKMGKDRISSQEIADYTNINATQIRRDLSGFGKFGKRGVGYNIDSLLDVPTDVQVHTSNPAVELLYALYFHLT